MSQTNERPTPETDAFIESLNDDFDVEFAMLTAHACNLERERDELREDNERLARLLGEWKLRAEKAEEKLNKPIE